MHRKFITLILASSIAVTSLSAVPAYADGKTARQFGWLALLGVVALAVQDSNRKRNVTRTYNYTTPPPNYNTPPRQNPPRVSSRFLPQQCLRSQNVNGQWRKIYGANCLSQYNTNVGSLPYACQIGYTNGRYNKVGYEPRCLREHGFRTARR